MWPGMTASLGEVYDKFRHGEVLYDIPNWNVIYWVLGGKENCCEFM